MFLWCLCCRYCRLVADWQACCLITRLWLEYASFPNSAHEWDDLKTSEYDLNLQVSYDTSNLLSISADEEWGCRSAWNWSPRCHHPSSQVFGRYKRARMVRSLKADSKTLHHIFNSLYSVVCLIALLLIAFLYFDKLRYFLKTFLLRVHSLSFGKY